MTTPQLIFGSPLIGLVMKHDTSCMQCGGVAVIVGEPKKPHAGSLRCQTCSRRRGWLPNSVAAFLTETIRNFGLPEEPIEIRTWVGVRTAAPSGASATPEISAPTGAGDKLP
jgi:hypothetical protein